ncbi:MAG: hypothetical protein ACFBZ9_03055, partial [Sphingomonadales bacterium]
MANYNCKPIASLAVSKQSYIAVTKRIPEKVCFSWDVLLKKSETISAATLDSSNSSDEAEEHSGDVCAKTIRTLYEQHSPVLIAALRKDFGDGPPDPEDIAHQAFQKIIERAKLS